VSGEDEGMPWISDHDEEMDRNEEDDEEMDRNEEDDEKVYGSAAEGIDEMDWESDDYDDVEQRICAGDELEF
jgi:hypothetical protein